MKLRGLIIAAAIVLGANAWALLAVAWNHGGEPDAEIVLTEREVPLGSPSRDEGDLLSLRLTWQGSGAGRHRPDAGGFEDNAWFDRAKLEEIGFDCSVSPDSSGASEFYQKQLALPAYVVLEYEGESWKRRLDLMSTRVDEVQEKMARSEATQRDLDAAKRALAETREGGSRLTVVDAGKDPGALRARHPDRHRAIVAAAVVAPAVVGITPTLRGLVLTVRVQEINVPRAWTATLTPPQLPAAAQPGAPRYTATLRFGRKLEPWIVDVQPMPPRGESGDPAPPPDAPIR